MVPFYTFVTTDKGVEPKEFLVRLSFNQYDEVIKGDKPLVHPDTEKPLKKWKRVMDNVNYNFAQPEDSSRYDNFEYRAADKLFKAQEERRVAEKKSHMGETPYQDRERVDVAAHDINKFEGKVV